MTIKSGKKKWFRPELTVLVRNKPEDALVTACHEGQGKLGGPDFASSNQRCCFSPCGDACFDTPIS